MLTRLHRAAAFVATFTVCTTASLAAFGQDSYDLYGSQSFYDSSALQSQDLFEGWWLGGTIGGSTVSYSRSPGSVSADGVNGGIVGGYTWQHGPFVLGVEGDFLASDVSGGSMLQNGLNKARVGFDTLPDVRLRAGYTILPNLLLFGTFGGAWGNGDVYISGAGSSFSEETFFGWSAGGGAEYAYDQNWSLRFDYQYTDFESQTVSYPGGKQSFDPDSNTFRGSIIYRF